MKHTRARAALPLRQPWSGATVTSAWRDAGVTTSFVTAPAFSTHSTVVLSGACSLRTAVSRSPCAQVTQQRGKGLT